ncbi:MAG: superinfection exclusion B family protein [Anaerolineales bacterium]|nr:superinfection exclusion B family protein [Anaerolineales bacterium]
MIEQLAGALSTAMRWLIESITIRIVLASFTTILLFTPHELIERVGLLDFRNENIELLGIVFLLSSIWLTIDISSRFIVMPIKSHKALKRRQQYLHGLTPEEATILASYIRGNTRTLYLNMSSGVVNGLVHQKVIYSASSTGTMPTHWAYNIQPWAWDYLQKHPEILQDAEDAATNLAEPFEF